MFLRFLVIVGLALAAACSDPIDVSDAGADAPDAFAPPFRELVLEVDSDLSLTSGEEVEVVVRVIDVMGETVTGAMVDFALDGTAHDSSLGTLIGRTGRDGRASATITAGTTAAAFRVRISGDGADDIFLRVAVSDAGFGTLLVHAEYEGDREVDSIAVRVYADTRCEDERTMVGRGDRAMRLAVDERETRFFGLPAEVSYAIVAQGDGPSGTTLARGCVEDVILGADEEAELTITLGDLPLTTTGVYDTGVVLATSDSADTLNVAVTERGAATLEARGGAASAILAGVENILAIDGIMTDFERLERRDEAVRMRLAETFSDRLGPSSAIVELGALLRESTQETELLGSMRIDPEGAGITFDVREVFVHSATGEMRRMPDVDGVTADLTGSLMTDEESLVIDELAVSLPLGRYALAVFMAAATERDFGTARDMFVDSVGCEEIGMVISEELRVSCGAECLVAGCQDAMDALFTDIEAEVAELDVMRDQIRLDGVANLGDEDDDLRVDAVVADDLSGGWYGADGEFDPVSASFRATRAPVPD